jgi:CRP/FNR family cyclic AMP-dependent transcriptional regulator
MSFVLKELFNSRKREPRGPDIRETLKSIPIFTDLSRRELAAVERILHLREYATDEIVFRQEEPGLGMYIIESGRVKIVSDDMASDVSELGDGEFFGELPLLDGGTRSATAIAKSPCRIYGFFQPDLYALIERNPRLGVKIVLSLAAIIGMRLRAANERMESFTRGGENGSGRAKKRARKG